jgi:hypothetical protein
MGIKPEEADTEKVAASFSLVSGTKALRRLSQKGFLSL